ncbi:hypothetical protein BDQ17DRAFT_235017 [Cyathus striatus]|nr:hypothetical protein BDQ17DRAFT_235017 [Cyathus striatus]
MTERLLSLHERPANILRRRLEQAGYDGVDCLEKLGMYRSLSFLLKFVYKSTLSTFRESSLDDIRFGISTNIDLTGRGLRLIPVSLYVYASSIVTLKLSRNPIFEIPLDFIQECISLCELKLSHMAMKKVPPSIQHSPNLNKLDLSSNRIGDLDEAFLDGISSLNVLLLHNNKIERCHGISRACTLCPVSASPTTKFGSSPWLLRRSSLFSS